MALQSQSKEENASDSSLMPQRDSRQKDRYFSGQCNPSTTLNGISDTFPVSFRKKSPNIIGSHRLLYKKNLLPIKCLFTNSNEMSYNHVSHHTQHWRWELEIYLVESLTCFPCEPQQQIPSHPSDSLDRCARSAHSPSGNLPSVATVESGPKQSAHQGSCVLLSPAQGRGKGLCQTPHISVPSGLWIRSRQRLKERRGPLPRGSDWEPGHHTQLRHS